MVLMLMMLSKGHDGGDLGQSPLIELLQQVKDMLIDVAAVSISLLHARARDQPAFRPAVPLSQRVVIRVEEIGGFRVKGLVPRKRGAEGEGLPKTRPLGN